MEFRILGPLQAIGADGAVTIGGGRERALLARLLVSVNQVVSSEHLIEDVWDGDPPEGASRGLSVYVSRLRKALREAGVEEVIVTQAPGYVLRVEPDHLDAVRFEALMTTARRRAASGDPEGAAAMLREALALWHGPALADVADAPFARAEAARLEEARLTALEERIDADLACRRHGEVVGELGTLVSAHPLRERLWGQRMLALYRSGRQAEALRAYRELRGILGEELGIEPSAALARLETAIVRQEPELDWQPSGPSLPPAVVPRAEMHPPPPPESAPATAAPVPGPSAVEGGVVTFLFTDVVGSTELLQHLGDDAAEELRRRHVALLREAVAAQGGTEVKGLGDGLMVAFASPLAATRCAVAMQQAVECDNRRRTGSLAVRVGLHAGEPISHEHDYFGTPVVMAKRLCDRAEGGQILASALVRALVGSPGGHAFQDVGALSLKGLDEPVAACEVAWSPLAADVGVLPLPVPLQREESFPPVGREAELDRLEAARAEVSAGHRRLVLVAGEPGIGKTRLAAEAARRAHAEGATVLFGRCDEGMGVPYQPFVESLGAYLRQAPDPVLGRLGGELMRLVPEVLERAPGFPPPLRSDPETERYRLFDAVAAWLSAASEVAPALLVVDDLHWATRPTLLLLRHLVRSGEALRLLVVATYRDTEPDISAEVADVVAELLRQPGVERLSLAGLDEAGVAAFVEARARHELDAEGRALARIVHTETAGNPFFVGQVLRHLAETGAIVRREGRWVLGPHVAQVGIPEDARDVITRRLAQLPEETRDVLTVAAVMGDRVELAVLVEAAGMAEVAALRALDPAVAARLVTEVPGPTPAYRFVHALVRATLYEQVAAARRAGLHRRVGEAIETVHVGPLDDHLPALALHFARAAARGDPAKAVAYTTRAGDRALAQLAHDEAVSYYHQALELLSLASGAIDPAQRCDLLISLGEAQRRAGDRAHRQTLLDAAQLARHLGDAERLARAALANHRGFFSISEAVDDERVAALEMALDTLDPGDSHLRALLLATLASELAFSPDYDRRHGLAEEALAVARRLDEPATLARVLVERQTPLWVPPARAERLRDAEELAALVKTLDDPLLEIWAAFVGFVSAVEAGDMAAAAHSLEVALQIAGDLAQPLFQWLVTNMAHLQSRIAGRLEEAEALAEEAYEIGRAAGIPDAFYLYTAQVFWVRYDQGRLGEIIDLYVQAAARERTRPTARAAAALALAELDRDDEARAVLAPLAARSFEISPLSITWLLETTLLAEACARVGEPAWAELLYERLEPWGPLVPTAGAGAARASVHHYLGLLAESLGRHDVAADHFADAVAVHVQMAAPAFLAGTRLEWARTLLARGGPGDGERAGTLLGHALATARDLGLGAVQRRAGALLREVGDRDRAAGKGGLARNGRRGA